MKTHIRLFLAAATLIATMNVTTSCKKDKDILDPLTGETVEEGLALAPDAIFKDYPGETLIVRFTYGSVIRERVEFTFEAEGPAQVSISPADGFPKKENYAVRSTLTVQFNEDADAPVRVKLIATQAGKSQSKVLEFEPFYIKVNAQPIVLAADYGATTKLEYTVTTNLDNPQFEAVMESNPYFTFENNIITAIRKNISGKNREGKITVREKDGNGILSAYIPITQKSFPHPDNLVDFRCEALKAALVERFDTDYDGEISTDEALAVDEIDIRGCGVTDLTGIGAFKKAWKLDAQDNDIVDGTDIKGMRQLYWLDLKGNKNLQTFDITGCTIYFEWFDFEVTENLKYYLLENQVQKEPLTVPHDDARNAKYFHRVKDERQTKDWSHHNELRLVREHKKGNGRPMVFWGLSYIDEDIKDGSFERLFTDYMTLVFDYCTESMDAVDYFDIYFYSHIRSHRYEWAIWEGDYEVVKQRIKDWGEDNRIIDELIGLFVPKEKWWLDGFHSYQVCQFRIDISSYARGDILFSGVNTWGQLVRAAGSGDDSEYAFYGARSLREFVAMSGTTLEGILDWYSKESGNFDDIRDGRR